MRQRSMFSHAALAMAAAALMSGNAGVDRFVIPTRSPVAQAPIPPIAAEPRIRQRLTRKQLEVRNRRRRRRDAVSRSRRKRSLPSAYQAAVNRLTNWQRQRWASAGYPGQKHQDASAVQPFIELRRPA